MKHTLKMVVPKGRLQEKVFYLLERVGIRLMFGNDRSYRPLCSDPDIEIKILKPQNVPSLIALGRHDCGFTGYDWMVEQNLDHTDQLVEKLDLGFNRVRLVAAVPEELVENEAWQSQRLVVASEYERLAQQYIREKKLDAVFIKAYGATEALPPEDADLIIDNTSTGSTLRMNRLVILDDLLTSTTRFVCYPKALADPCKKDKLDQLTMLFQSVLNAESRVLLEMNVSKDNVETLVASLPSMRSPTVSPLYNHAGYAVKVAVPSKEVSSLIPALIALGATDILEYRLEKIVP